MANIFNSVKGLHPKRNAFSAHTYRNDFTAPLGVNLPVYIQEVPPATRAMVSTSALVRLQALIAPVMDNIDYYVHFWKLPYRIIEDDRFTAFISGEIEAADYDALFATPYELAVAVENALYSSLEDTTTTKFYYNAVFGNGSVLDFLGYDVDLFPSLSFDQDEVPEFTGGNKVTKLNWRGLIAYFMLHENWYMNENVPYYDNFVELVKEVVSDQDLTSLASLLALTAQMHGTFSCSFLPHAWEKDYFTSALPNVQYGTPVQLPLGGSAPVRIAPYQFVDIQGNATGEGYDPLTITLSGGSLNDDQILKSIVTAELPSVSKGILRNADDETIDGVQGYMHNILDGIADLSQATAITINELRFANALQVFKERQMRYGRRRQEYYKGFFDVSPEDLRLQLPKYLGGGRIPINISDIEQTSQTSGSQALGHLAGKATAVAGGFAGFTTFCSEESVIIGIAFSMPHITYAKQLSRFKMKTNDIYDYFNPSFEHLGEQAVKNIELYSGATEPDGDFGYQPRYTEYRFHSNEMHGAFKDTLSFWSLGRIFSSQPALNADFVYMQPAVFDRIFAVTGQPNMIVSMLFKVRLIQPVSKYGTPMLLA